MQDHPRIAAQLPIDLAGAHIHGMHPEGAVLQQAIGESASGRSHIETDAAAGFDAETIESGGELETSAADVGRSAQHLQVGVRGHALAGLLRFHAINQHFPGEHQSLPFLSRLGETAFGQHHVEPDSHQALRRTM